MNELIIISEEKIVQIQALKSTFTVTATQGDNRTQFNITGISIIPQFIELKPNDIRSIILNKNQTELEIDKIDEYTGKGIYFVNIRDYSSNEIQYLSKHIADKLLSEIWTLLTAKESKRLTFSLNDQKLR
jgi:hypothetical protein